MGPRKELLILVFALSLFSIAQPPDYHVTGDPFHATYCRSAFLHGHRHGYEDGYHAADQDIHLGRAPQILTNKFRVPKMIGYRSEYGSKGSFRHGYEAGFMAGYSDSYTGRQFNHPDERLASLPSSTPGAVKQNVEPSAQVSATPAPNADAAFDSGVYEGYRSALADQESYQLQPGLARYAEDFCRINLLRGTGPGFCSGYGSGFLLGKSDAARRMRPDADNAVRVAKNQP